MAFLLLVTLAFAIAGIAYGVRSELPPAAPASVAGGLTTLVLLVVVGLLVAIVGWSLLFAPVASGLATRITYAVRRVSLTRRTPLRRSERDAL